MTGRNDEFHRGITILRKAVVALLPGHGCEEQGQSLVEFALLTAVSLPLLAGIVYFGIAFNNQIALTNAVNTAAQSLILGKDISDPCATVNNALYLAAGSLNNPNIYGSNPLSFSITAGSTTVGPYQVVFASSGGPQCNATSATPLGLTQYSSVSVTATYGCSLSIYGVNYFKNCVLSATTSEVVQ
jgi:Flp pilus assembly protein TadG